MRACFQFPDSFRNRTLFWEVKGDKSESVLFFLNAEETVHFHHVACSLPYMRQLTEMSPCSIKARTDDRLRAPPTSHHMMINLFDLIPGCKCNFIKYRLRCISAGHS